MDSYVDSFFFFKFIKKNLSLDDACWSLEKPCSRNDKYYLSKHSVSRKEKKKKKKKKNPRLYPSNIINVQDSKTEHEEMQRVSSGQIVFSSLTWNVNK